MGTILVSEINDAIANTMRTISSISAVQSYNQLSEAINDWPLIQVYPESGEANTSGSTERRSFGAGVRHQVFTFNMDVYAAPRNHIDENMLQVVNLVDLITIKLEEQDTLLFGNSGIKAFKWNWQRVVLSTSNREYAGIRFVIMVDIF